LLKGLSVIRKRQSQNRTPSFLQAYARGWSHMSTKKSSFGELSSKDFEVGDIVEWTKWNSQKERFDKHYGVLLEVKNQIKSNRFVSISRVLPLTDEQVEKEFFTLSLCVVSRGCRNIDTKED